MYEEIFDNAQQENNRRRYDNSYPMTTRSYHDRTSIGNTYLRSIAFSCEVATVIISISLNFIKFPLNENNCICIRWHRCPYHKKNRHYRTLRFISFFYLSQLRDSPYKQWIWPKQTCCCTVWTSAHDWNSPINLKARSSSIEWSLTEILAPRR